MSKLQDLLNTFPRAGRVDWIGLSPKRRGTIQVVTEVEAQLKTGLVGDRHASGGRSKRQVTLIQREHLQVVSALMGRAVTPDELRRNVVVSGINLYALRKSFFRIGEVVLQGTGICDPCSRMEENLGPGGLNAMRGHGGITAIVVEPGIFRIDDEVRFIEHTVGFSDKSDLH
jgi:MOSC domain-containing protein YiiM